MTSEDTAGEASFDLDTFLRLPRLSNLRLAPDGSRLVVDVSTPAPDGKRFRSSIWELDPEGTRPARRLTRSRASSTTAGFTPDGRLLFTSPRPDPEADDEPDDPPAALHVLPHGAGEPTLVLAPPAGVGTVRTARHADVAVLEAEVHPGADDLDADEQRGTAREEAGVSAQLFEHFPIRRWDRWLGPRRPVLWRLRVPGDGDDVPVEVAPIARDDGDALDDVAFDLSPDGRTLVTGWRRVDEPDVRQRVVDLVAVDVETGERRTLLADEHLYDDVAISPDGRHVAAVRESVGDPDTPPRVDLVLVDLADGAHRVVAPELDLWPTAPRWLPDGGALVCVADEAGHAPILRIDLDEGGADRVTRLTASGNHSDVQVAPDGRRLYALRSTIGRPPHPVVVDLAVADQDADELPSPAAGIVGPGRVEDVATAVADGTSIRSWLVLPAGASGDAPAPLVTFVHGGPLSSWNAWHWRWNAHVLAARGYAVLLPDPALSTGYGQAMIARGWGRWGDTPYTDVMAAVDGACEHEAVDGERLALMGGSFGGYLANWIAGHTDRFQAIVTHASLWHLEGFHGTTDLGPVWEFEFGDPYVDASRYREWSPHRFADRITTPMLVIHGERDYRVPLSEALQLWTAVARHQIDAQFLYFPDENHWVLKPQNARLWYETVLAFLDHHVLGAPFRRPDLL